MFVKFPVALFMLILISTAVRAAAPDIGETIAVKNEATLESRGTPQPLIKGLIVHQDDTVVTGADASAEIQLLDKTKLAVGPGSRMVLDKFVYDPSASKGSISLGLSKGAFRFITGLAPKEAYEIKTPTASLGVRGTVFDVYVAENGETAVLLHHGGVQLCNLSGSCRLQERAGSIFFVGMDGAISQHSKCDKAFIYRLGAETAFPFIGKSLAVDPVSRMSVLDFECTQIKQRPITATPATSQPPPPQTPDMPPAAVLGLATAGGLIIGVPILENKPVSP
jgi:hypothetical protein